MLTQQEEIKLLLTFFNRQWCFLQLKDHKVEFPFSKLCDCENSLVILDTVTSEI